jgi:hypothetical protein
MTVALMLAGAAVANAASVDKDDPYRAVGRENDVRVDAQLLSDVVSPGDPIALTYEVHNFTAQPVAIAEKLCTASYDSESRTITVSVGSEIPPDGHLPKMTTIAPGETRAFTTAARLHAAMPSVASRLAALPRDLQVKISVLRNLAPFRDLLSRQQETKAPAALPLSDVQFDEWLEGNDTIFLNTLPIRYEAGRRGGIDAARQNASSM